MVMFIERETEIWKQLAEVVSDEGFLIYDLERIGASGLRVTIAANTSSTTDSAISEDTTLASQGSVTSLDCSRVCKRLLVFLAVEGPALGLKSEPQLEVSSPGVNRNLRSAEHFEGAVGERVKVVCVRSGEDNRSEQATAKNGSPKEVLGVLENFVGERLSIRDELSKELVDLDLSNIKKARVDFHFGS